MYGLRIVLAEPDPLFRKHLKEKLLKAGYMVVGEASDGRKALQIIFNIQPDLTIMNLRLPGRDGLEVAKIIEEHRVSPVLLITELNDQEEIKEALEHWLLHYIVNPVEEVNLFPAIEVAVNVFRKVCQLEEQNRKLEQLIETRKLVEKAKGLLVEYKGMTEQQAFKYIQKQSMDKCMPIQNIAKQIVLVLGGRKMQKRSDFV